VIGILRLVRLNRMRRFGEVWRTEGWRSALRAARKHLIMARHGHVPGAVAALAVPEATPAGQATGSCALTDVWIDLARNNAFHVTSPPALLRRRRRIAMIGDLNLPQCRKYRVEQLDEIWGRAEVGYGFAHYEDIPRCLDLLQGATHLMLYRLGQSSLVEMYLYEARRLRLPVIYDIDDPLFSFSAYATYGNGAAMPDGLRRHLVGQSPSYLSVMSQADMLSLSTPGLVDAASTHSPRPAFLRRNFADRATLEAGERAARTVKRDGFTLAFASGSIGHEIDFLTIRDDLSEFLAGGEGRRLLILGRFDLGQVSHALAERAEVVPFRDYPGYLTALARADCAILPLADDAFNRCKSAVRVIDAAAVAVPSVVGPVGDGQAMVRDGVTGLVAEPDPGGWRSALERLAGNPREAAKIGRAAREDLEARWSASTEMPVVSPELVTEIAA